MRTNNGERRHSDLRHGPLARAAGALLVCLAPMSLPSAGSAQTAATAPSYLEAIAPREWSFPRDHGRHDRFKTEWWYFTGNLKDEAGHRFGYQLTFFRTAFTPETTTRPSPWAMRDLYFAHAAITDVDGKRFASKDRLARGREGLAASSDQTMDVSLLDWSAKLDADGRATLKCAENGFAIDLACEPGRGPILQGPGGVNAKGEGRGQASYYYSMTRLPTTGALSLDGKTIRVTGESWMDHEFSSNALSKNQSGWDWMGLSLANGDDLMIYRLRNTSGGTDYLSGTRIMSDGTPHYLTSSDITLAAGSRVWTSPVSGGAYPQEWKLTVKGEPPMAIRSRLENQELNTPGSTNASYFEGSIDVLDESGHDAGEGYLEMTGYAKAMGGSF